LDAYWTVPATGWPVSSNRRMVELVMVAGIMSTWKRTETVVLTGTFVCPLCGSTLWIRSNGVRTATSSRSSRLLDHPDALGQLPGLVEPDVLRQHDALAVVV